jgi:hypothetical protein
MDLGVSDSERNEEMVKLSRRRYFGWGDVYVHDGKDENNHYSYHKFCTYILVISILTPNYPEKPSN